MGGRMACACVQQKVISQEQEVRLLGQSHEVRLLD